MLEDAIYGDGHFWAGSVSILLARRTCCQPADWWWAGAKTWVVWGRWAT